MSSSAAVPPETQSASILTQIVRKLQQENERLIKALEETAAKLSDLREKLHPHADAVINDILTTVNQGLGLKQTDSLYLTRGQYQYARRKRMERELHLRTYIRSSQLCGYGFTVRYYILIHILLTYITAESSETQHLSSMLLRIVYSLLHFQEKILSLVNETRGIDKPLSSDLIPDATTTTTSSSSSSNRLPLQLSPSIDDSSGSEPPLIDVIINSYGAQLIVDILRGDMTLINLLGDNSPRSETAATDDSFKSNAQDTVCFTLFNNPSY